LILPSGRFVPSFPQPRKRSVTAAGGSRAGYYVFAVPADTPGIVIDRYTIDDYLSESWIERWVDDVVSEVEDYLGKHAAFDAFLEGDSEPV